MSTIQLYESRDKRKMVDILIHDIIIDRMAIWMCYVVESFTMDEHHVACEFQSRCADP
jgi:hypothetical protein